MNDHLLNEDKTTSQEARQITANTGSIGGKKLRTSTKTLICIAIGLIIAGALLSGASYLLSGGNRGEFQGAMFFSSSRPFVQDNRQEVNQVIERFDNLELICDYADVELIPTEKEEYAISYSYYPKLGEPRISANNGTLVYEQFPERIRHRDLGQFNGMYVKIYYPRDAAFQRIDVENSAGDLHIAGLNAPLIDLDLDFGYLWLSQLAVDDLQLSLGAGDCELDRVTADRLEIDCDFGNLTTKETITNDLSIQMSAGDADLRGTFNGDNEIAMDFGDLTFRSTLAQDQYTLDLDVDLGEVRIEGQKVRVKDIAASQGPNQIKVDNSAGSMHFYFGV